MPPARETTSGRLATANRDRTAEARIPAVRRAYSGMCRSRLSPVMGLSWVERAASGRRAGARPGGARTDPTDGRGKVRLSAPVPLILGGERAQRSEGAVLGSGVGAAVDGDDRPAPRTVPQLHRLGGGGGPARLRNRTRCARGWSRRGRAAGGRARIGRGRRGRRPLLRRAGVREGGLAVRGHADLGLSRSDRHGRRPARRFRAVCAAHGGAFGGRLSQRPGVPRRRADDRGPGAAGVRRAGPGPLSDHRHDRRSGAARGAGDRGVRDG